MFKSSQFDKTLGEFKELTIKFPLCFHKIFPKSAKNFSCNCLQLDLNEFKTNFFFQETATSHLKLEPDWASIMVICDLIRQNDIT